jgi:hypothetical protein
MGTVKAFRRLTNMKIKVIEVSSPEIFRNIYMGFIGGGNSSGEKKKSYGSAGVVARLERRIKVKLKEISEEVPSPAANAVPRTLKEGTQTLRLTADEFKMLNDYLNNVEWLTSGAEEVADMFDAIDAATTEEDA